MANVAVLVTVPVPLMDVLKLDDYRSAIRPSQVRPTSGRWLRRLIVLWKVSVVSSPAVTVALASRFTSTWNWWLPLRTSIVGSIEPLGFWARLTLPEAGDLIRYS